MWLTLRGVDALAYSPRVRWVPRRAQPKQTIAVAGRHVLGHPFVSLRTDSLRDAYPQDASIRVSVVDGPPTAIA
jgi:hypothetical protein